ncbi:hypothetical protein HORM4_280040 [Vibrio harveyi]|nr:hypothetical protein HORM4_280040 [Vibrio harveyi]
MLVLRSIKTVAGLSRETNHDLIYPYNLAMLDYKKKEKPIDLSLSHFIILYLYPGHS